MTLKWSICTNDELTKKVWLPNTWVPTPEDCKYPENLVGIEKVIYQKLVSLKDQEKLNPHLSETERMTFLENFENSIFNPDAKRLREDLLVEFHDIFSRHHLDVSWNTEFKVKLTPEHDKPIYTQSPPTPIHLKYDLHVQLALFQYYGIVTTLAYSNYSSPIFAKRNASGKLRILIDLRKVNHLIRHDYDTNNFPIATVSASGEKNHFSRAGLQSIVSVCTDG